MRVACDRRDQDLLFLSHGLLGGLRQMFTRSHLRKCDACRNRVATFGAAERALRLAFDAPARPIAPPVRVGRRLMLAALAILLLLAAVGATDYFLGGGEAGASYPQRDLPVRLQRAETCKPPPGDVYGVAPKKAGPSRSSL